MKANYRDILSRIKEEPKWYDENGTPRYEKFHPDLSPDIYADEVILLEIACQNCGKRFFVEMNYSVIDKVMSPFAFPLSKDTWRLHYGDPPIHGCVGDTMNCDDIKVIEFWQKENFGWKRKKNLEIKLRGFASQKKKT